MKVINIFDINVILHEKFPPLTIALGFFDGVHAGHQEVFNIAKQKAEMSETKLAVMTFSKLPKNVLNPNDKVQELTSLEQKLSIFEDLSFDYAFVIDFTLEFANCSAKDFVEKFLLQNNVKMVVAGTDFAFGKNGSSSVSDIYALSKNVIKCEKAPEVSELDKKISSTLARQLVSEGDFVELERILYNKFSVSGEVVHGEKRGRTIGFPTANVEPNHNFALPKVGVYIVEFNVNGGWHNGVCSIGYKPTFRGDINEPVIEVHLLDFKDDIYGKNVTVVFRRKIRDEIKFNGFKELVSRINKDVEVAKKFFEGDT